MNQPLNDAQTSDCVFVGTLSVASISSKLLTLASLAEYVQGRTKRSAGDLFNTPDRSTSNTVTNQYVHFFQTTFSLKVTLNLTRFVPNSLESRPTTRQSVRDPKRPRPSGIAMMAASAAFAAGVSNTTANPWFRARPIHLGLLRYIFFVL